VSDGVHIFLNLNIVL